MLKDNRLEFLSIIIESYKYLECPANYELASRFLEELDKELFEYKKRDICKIVDKIMKGKSDNV